MKLISKDNFAILFTVLLAACGSSIDDSLGSDKIRKKAIQDSAIAYGAQSALAWQSEKINSQLASKRQTLDKIYNFRNIMLPHNVLPPVLRESTTSLKLDDNNTLRSSDRSIEIIQDAKFVTTAPSWRDYLIMTFNVPDKPLDSMLPNSSEEREEWDKYITIGWEKGYKQANAILREKLGKLSQDYAGMAYFKKLYLQGMVTAPQVATADLGITGNTRKLSINDRITRITSNAELNIYRAQNWKPGLSFIKAARKKKTDGIK